MSVPNQTPYIIYNANGLTTVFPFEFYIINAGDIQVSINGTTVTSGYSVSGTGNVVGGDVTFITPPASGSIVMLERVVPTYRLTDYQDNGDLLADTVNKDFDRLWMAIQRSFIYLGLALRRPLLGGPFNAEGYRIEKLADPLNAQDAATKNYVDNVSLVRALRVPESYVPVLPPVSQRANRLLAFNDSGNPIAVLPASGSASDVMVELAKPTAPQLIGTNHRGTVQLDLDAIDRRPSGYGDSVSAVLANGQDVEIEKTYLLSSPILPADFQVIDGKGGNLQMSAIARAISVVSKKGVAIWNARAVGTVVNGPSAANVAYCVVAEDCSNLKIYGVDASKFSGAVELLRTTDFIIRDVFARNMRYHSDVAAGGYGVLLEGCSRGLIDGINFRASTADGDLGRHALYISVDVLGNFCEDIIVKNLIASYVNIDNRNMPAVVVRRSNRCMIEDFNINGSNGGVGLNADNGNITDLQIRNGHMKIIQHDDNAVYGISGGVDGQPNTVVGLRVDNYTFEGEVKSGVTPATISLHAIAMTCRDSYFTNTRIKSHGSANPILVRPGTFNTTFDGIKDFVTAGSATAPLIRFQGSNSNIKIFNIDTARSPFAGLDNVTDLTVNWERFARIVSANGTVTTTDTESLISTVSATGTGELTVSFKPHVTADAVRKCTVTPASVAGLVILPEISGKNLILRFYNGSGALVPLGASIVSADIRLHS
ncbi:phage tail fiber protein [Enterobacter hormaechei]